MAMPLVDLKRRALPFFLCGVALCLGGCVETSGPLTDPLAASVDTNLLGTWTGATASGKAATITFGRSDAGGVMTEDEIDIDSQKGTTSQIARKLFIASTLNGHNYISYDASSGDTTQTYYISQYSISGDELDIWSGDASVENQLIQQGTLSGKASEFDPKADPTSLAQYLTNNTGDDLFPSSSLAMTLHRVSAPPAPDAPATPPAAATPSPADSPAPSSGSAPSSDPAPTSGTAPSGTAPGTPLWLPVIIFVGIGGLIILTGIVVGAVVYIAKNKPDS